MNLRTLLVMALFSGVSTAAEAQKNCKKGIPCGNSCISADKVCRIGSAPPPAPTRQPAAEPTSRTAASFAGLGNMEGKGAWVASVDGTVYYLRGCPTAAKLTDDETVSFTSELEAKADGYKRSKARNC